ncbi:MAG: DUF4838 domain-containing protein [Planctomycetia bacterium]
MTDGWNSGSRAGGRRSRRDRTLGLAVALTAALAGFRPWSACGEEAAGGPVPGADAIRLAEDGRSDYSIAVGADPPAPVAFAAAELQKYLLQITGVRLPIVPDAAGEAVVCVGAGGRLPEAFAELRADLRSRGEDGYLMCSMGRRIVLVGNSPRATLYAVYHFLEKHLGCGWCVPGDDTVPRRPSVRLPPFDDRVGPPAMAMRQIVIFPYGGEWLAKNNLPHTDWLAKNRFNWAHPAPNEPYSWERNRSREAYVPEVEKRGLYLDVGGHTFNTWLPPDEHARTHPEYFAVLDQGGRAVESTEKAGLCLSHPDVAPRMAQNIIRWLDENPEVDVVDIWHNDSYTYCHCPKCTPGGATETESRAAYTRTYIRFANQVAGLVAERHPRHLLNLLAYAHTINCPPDAERLRDNVLVGLCLFPRPTQRTMRPLETSPQRLDGNLRRQIPAWRKQAKNFYVYEYYTFSPQEKVWSMVSMLADDIRYFQRLGIDGISSDQWGPHWYPLNMYAFGKLLWNPRLEPEEIIADFCARHYGRAGATMAAYWGLLEEGLRESWNTETAVDWRDEKRLALIRRALSEADGPTEADRIRATAELHQLPVTAAATGE